MKTVSEQSYKEFMTDYIYRWRPYGQWMQTEITTDLLSIKKSFSSTFSLLMSIFWFTFLHNFYPSRILSHLIRRCDKIKDML